MLSATFRSASSDAQSPGREDSSPFVASAPRLTTSVRSRPSSAEWAVPQAETPAGVLESSLKLPVLPATAADVVDATVGGPGAPIVSAAESVSEEVADVLGTVGAAVVDVDFDVADDADDADDVPDVAEDIGLDLLAVLTTRTIATRGARAHTARNPNRCVRGLCCSGSGGFETHTGV